MMIYNQWLWTPNTWAPPSPSALPHITGLHQLETKDRLKKNAYAGVAPLGVGMDNDPTPSTGWLVEVVGTSLKCSYCLAGTTDVVHFKTVETNDLAVFNPTITHDQLRRVVLSWVNERGRVKLWWYNPLTARDEIRDMGSGRSATVFIDYSMVNPPVAPNIWLFTMDAEGTVSCYKQADRYDIKYNCNLGLDPIALLVGGGPRSDGTIGLLCCLLERIP